MPNDLSWLAIRIRPQLRLGGYTLARPAGEITMGEIVRCLDTPYVPSQDSGDRPLTLVFEAVLLAMWGTLDRMTLAQIVGRRRR
jgi:DNA-binding IscR family transcriptional regulator